MNYDNFRIEHDTMLTPDGSVIYNLGFFNHDGRVKNEAAADLQSVFNKEKAPDDKMVITPNPHTGDVDITCNYGTGKTVTRGARVLFIEAVCNVFDKQSNKNDYLSSREVLLEAVRLLDVAAA